jgi:hypothetical protein
MYGISWTSLTLLAFLVQATLGAHFSLATATQAGDTTDNVQADAGLQSQTPFAPIARSLTCRRVLVCRLQMPTPLAECERLCSRHVSIRPERMPHALRQCSSLQWAQIRLQI